jgi:hypothetical protein
MATRDFLKRYPTAPIKKIIRRQLDANSLVGTMD